MLIKPNEATEPKNDKLTAMIDVVFLLLIFFMVATQFKLPDYSLAVPNKAGQKSNPEVVESVDIRLIMQGEKVGYYLNGVPFSDAVAMGDRLRSIRQHNDPTKVPTNIKPDSAVPFEAVVSTIDECKSEGFINLRFRKF